MALTPGVELFIGWCHASQRTSKRAGIRTNFVLAGSSRRSHPPPSSTILPNLHQPPQPPPTSTHLHNLPPSGGSLHIRERRHVEKPQPREPRVLVHLDEQQVGDTHDGGGALASYADVEHRLIRVFLHRERGVHLHGRDSWLRIASGTRLPASAKGG